MDHHRSNESHRLSELRRRVTLSLLPVLTLALWAATPASPARAQTPPKQVEFTFNYTGAPQTVTVPEGATRAFIDIFGARGGNVCTITCPFRYGGFGGRATGNLSVTPGDVITVMVGGQGGDVWPPGGSGAPCGDQLNAGAGGFNGGGAGGSGYCPGAGGGGATDIRIGGADLAHRVRIAGGGGGASNLSCAPGGGTSGNGGRGGGLTGTPGRCGGGAAGDQSGQSGSGQLGQGSAGSAGSPVRPPNPMDTRVGGGGGGGGYYGGAGGAAESGGGGGGSGSAASATSSWNRTGHAVIAFMGPPRFLAPPMDVTVDATGPSGATVTYPTPTAINIQDQPVPVTCALGSGSTFAIGTTTVTCTATDRPGNSATASFTVTVRGAAELLLDLEAAVMRVDRLGTAVTPISEARAAVAVGQVEAACRRLQDFVSGLPLQVLRLSAPAQATQFATDATRIRTVLACA